MSACGAEAARPTLRERGLLGRAEPILIARFVELALVDPRSAAIVVIISSLRGCSTDHKYHRNRQRSDD